jgi:hypothetical protein
MWTLSRLPEFYRAYQVNDPHWTPAEAAASLQFPLGLIVAVILATPFWTAVAVFVHHLAK